LFNPYHWKWYNSSINEAKFMQHEPENITKAMENIDAGIDTVTQI